jgi:hypothetical protein
MIIVLDRPGLVARNLGMSIRPAGSRAIDHDQSLSAIFVDVVIDVVITRVIEVRTAIVV